MVDIRRYFHQHPELSFQEKNTTEKIVETYRKLGIPFREHVGGNGVVATIDGKHRGKTVALRADFDALPIQDEKDVPYKSTVPGVMHACGHDAHTSTLLHVAEAFWQHKEDLKGTIVLIHQHAEELHPGGAKQMIEDGCLEGVDMIFGTHLWSTTPTGTVQVTPGPMMAAADRIDIVVQGKGGHGAEPHLAKDAILAASQLVTNLQTVVSRSINPLNSAVLTIGSFESKNAFNIIADQVKLSGTVRTFQADVRDRVEQEVRRICQGTALNNDVDIHLTYTRSYPAVVNDAKAIDFVKKGAATVPDIEDVTYMKPVMPAEDFSYYLQHVPGAFFFTGAQPEGVQTPYPHHHPKFDINEKGMLIAAKTLTAAALAYLQA
ncbi:amidohydrolase [Bacillaceae bacterium SIJ1]|nr:amidohydrolase [Litoribacterium kuwaitense]